MDLKFLCNTCKKEKDEREFVVSKLHKKCGTCRTVNKEKKEVDKKPTISSKKMFEYLKDKYDIDEDFNSVKNACMNV